MHDARQQKRIAVRLGLCHELSANVPGGARAILDDEGLSPGIAQALAVEPRHEVDAAAGRKADHNADRFARIAVLNLFLSVGRERWCCDGKECHESQNANLDHGLPPWISNPRKLTSSAARGGDADLDRGARLRRGRDLPAERCAQ